jgi:hypothetical protein
LYTNGLSKIPGFYEGQVTNYILFTSLVVFGFMIRSFNWKNLLVASVSAPTAYFLLSNLLVWTSGGGYGRSKTFAGLIQCYADGLPFYRNSIFATLFFTAVFFGSYYLLTKKNEEVAFA